MKISCQSCQSKYNVADEKVHGKIVKIRCRKCGSTIVVDGTKQAATNGSTASTTGIAPTHSPSYSVSSATSKADAQPWHVNVAEDDQRTMTLAEVVTAYGSGVITQETFIWTEGMEDWKPLSEVESVVLALHEAAAAPVSNSPGISTNGFGTDLGAGFGAASEAAPATALSAPVVDGADPTRVYPSARPEPASPQVAQASGLGTAAAAPRAEAKRAAVKREPRTRDLFASRTNPDELHSGGSPVESGGGLLQMSGSALPIDDSSKRLGERNENSVLFSLAMLTKTADIPASSDGAQGTPEDDSGLIDLKALAAKTESLRPGAMIADAAFSAPLGAIQPLGAPMGAMAAPLGDISPPKSRLPAVIGVTALLVFLLAAGVAIGVKWAGARPVQIAAAPITTEPTATPSAPADTAPSASAAASASQAPATPAPTATAARSHVGGGTGVHAQYAGNKAAAAAPNSGAAAAEGTPAPPPKKAGGDCGCNGDLMCLMKCSTHQ